ncbi:hypothetical protein G3O07_24080 [Pseudomonas laurentiana]|uniref:Uncharacterized protein n=1 Tax=Pseudomonas laurentiana TaxID=2364649 RepID=A0A6I5RXK5_9PSED|nr:hypothetical protein [Pseudomonas laurentiana]
MARQAYRDFRIDRMHNLQILPDGQKLGAEWNLRAYMQFQSAQWAANSPIEH